MAKHSPRFLKIVDEARKNIRALTVDDVKRMLDHGDKFHLVDVREESEWARDHMRRSILVFVGVLLAGMLVREALEAAKPTLRPIYKSPLGLAIDKSSQFAYVVLQTADALAVVDLRNNKVLDEIPVGKKPYDVALRHGIAYVTCEADDTLVAVDVAERKVLRRFK